MAENNMEQIRAFIAIELPEETQKEVASLQKRLKLKYSNCPAKWVSPESIHLTLNFLGDIPLARIAAIKNVLIQATTVTDAIELTFSGLGAFPDLVRPHTLWVGLGGDVNKLSGIQKRLEQLLVGLGCNHDNRPFSPHLTLARIPDGASAANKNKLGQAAYATTCEKSFSITVRKISLIKSLLTPAGPIYTVLFSAAIGNKS